LLCELLSFILHGPEHQAAMLEDLFCSYSLKVVNDVLFFAWSDSASSQTRLQQELCVLDDKEHYAQTL
jgi:hypothetical protein